MDINLSQMSPEELQFIRLYCALLRRQYYSVKAVMALMSPNNVAVRSPVIAARVASRLEVLGRDFDESLAAIRVKHKIKEKRMPRDEAAFLNELADIFALSFFKIVAVAEDTAEPVTLVKDGWCSGEPTSFAKQIEMSVQPADENQQTLMSSILSFFSNIAGWKKPTLYKKQPEPDEDRDEYDEDDEWYEDN